MSIIQWSIVLDRFFNELSEWVPKSERMLDNTQKVQQFIKDNQEIIKQIGASDVANQLNSDCQKLLNNIDYLDENFDKFKRAIITKQKDVEFDKE